MRLPNFLFAFISKLAKIPTFKTIIIWSLTHMPFVLPLKPILKNSEWSLGINSRLIHKAGLLQETAAGMLNESASRQLLSPPQRTWIASAGFCSRQGPHYCSASSTIVDDEKSCCNHHPQSLNRAWARPDRRIPHQGRRQGMFTCLMYRSS